jgi:hypothetical protein
VQIKYRKVVVLNEHATYSECRDITPLAGRSVHAGRNSLVAYASLQPLGTDGWAKYSEGFVASEVVFT